MSRAIDELMQEHRLIEKVLGSLEAFAEAAGKDGGASRETLGSYVRFFREFADRCHHGKEEDRLLVSMVKHGLPAAEKMIAPAELDRLAADFEVFEREVLGAGSHERLHALARSLLAAYPAAGLAPDALTRPGAIDPAKRALAEKTSGQ